MTDKKEKVESLGVRVGKRLRSGSLVTVVQEQDEYLATGECLFAGGMFQPTKVVSVSDPEVIEKLSQHKTAQGTLILHDFLMVHGENPIAVRLLREHSLQGMTRTKDSKLSYLILIEQPWVKIPQGLVGDCEVVTAKLPTVEDLTTELEQFIKSMEEIGKPITLPGNGEVKFSIASAVSGLSRHQASRLFSLSYVMNIDRMRRGEKVDLTIDPVWLRREKALVVTQRLNGALTFEDNEGASIGGYDAMKSWVGVRKVAFNSKKAKDYGLSNPKGLLLLGVPGCGKTAAAKMISRELELPLLRLDPGKLFGSLVGQSEAQTRMAIECATACSPCVLWIDEIEKGLGSSGGLDGGTSLRVFGTILTWLQENKEPIFVVATANSIEMLPPELLRKGRFDEIFFVDLPDIYERREIFKIHLGRRKIVTITEDQVHALSEACDNFSGAEIEQSIVEGQFLSFPEDRPLEYRDVLNAIKATKPLSKVNPEKITKIREWARTRTVPASKVREQQDSYSLGALNVPRRPTIG